MKHCPTCGTTYDEDILRFCIKDGTPLVDDKKPEFKEIPSEIPEDDFGEDTIIRRNKPPVPPQPSDNDSDLNTVVTSPQTGSRADSERIVVPTTPEEKPSQGIRPIDSTAHDSPRNQRHNTKKSNTPMVILLTVVGTLAVLAGAIGVYWFVSGSKSAEDDVNTNMNINIDENLDTNLDANMLLENMNLDANMDPNSNMGLDTNLDMNINVEKTLTPTPTPTKTPAPTPTPTPTPDAGDNHDENVNEDKPATTPTPAPKTPTPAPTHSQKPANTNLPVNVGQLNGRAISLPTPNYSPAARAAKASGQVTVKVILDESGEVISAVATSGHPLLRKDAESAARRSRFKPATLNGTAVKSTGVIAYKFIN